MSSFKQQSSSPSLIFTSVPALAGVDVQILSGQVAGAECVSRHRDTGKDHNPKLISSADFKALNTGKSDVSVQWKDRGTKINISKGLWTLNGF